MRSAIFFAFNGTWARKQEEVSAISIFYLWDVI
jgi:hypothetical protein